MTLSKKFKTFQEYKDRYKVLNESQFKDYLFEGIDVDEDNMIVKFNDTHEDIVDTSLSNPTVKTIKGIKTIMLFKRKKTKLKVSDGNPLVYALKAIKGWSISKEDRKAIMNRVNEIIKKVDDFDTIIVMPSSNPLVEELAKYLKKKAKRVLSKCVIKRDKQDIIDDMPWQNFTDKEWKKVEQSLKKMGEEFEAKHFPKDQSIIDKFEANLFHINADEYYNEIHNQKVLVIDDTISSGFSLANCSKTIKESYFPKSITQLSLFSDL